MRLDVFDALLYVLIGESVNITTPMKAKMWRKPWEPRMAPGPRGRVVGPLRGALPQKWRKGTRASFRAGLIARLSCAGGSSAPVYRARSMTYSLSALCLALSPEGACRLMPWKDRGKGREDQANLRRFPNNSGQGGGNITRSRAKTLGKSRSVRCVSERRARCCPMPDWRPAPWSPRAVCNSVSF